MITELTWKTGGYPHTFHVSRAGGYGCDPCWHCQRRPGRGEYVWTNTYGDLYCNRCAQQLARSVCQGCTKGSEDTFAHNH